jgi:hypothetical protein
MALEIKIMYFAFAFAVTEEILSLKSYQLALWLFDGQYNSLA